ncbi:MAG: hypothetical protein B6245_09360 [Desulfobacteraceae bacterium 4572_88]|nr:MAG: hypothetical protein B6245_09360 [Desulfobacteraceae bacterium 4572_88]
MRFLTNDEFQGVAEIPSENLKKRGKNKINIIIPEYPCLLCAENDKHCHFVRNWQTRNKVGFMNHIRQWIIPARKYLELLMLWNSPNEFHCYCQRRPTAIDAPQIQNFTK